MGEATSMKQVIQRLIPDQIGIQEGLVITEKPLSIRLSNDSKMLLGSNLLLVPNHLTKYKANIDIEVGEGALSSKTRDGQGIHGHGPSGGHSQYTGDGVHSHPETEGEHIHDVDTFKIIGGIMTVNNSLKKDEKVYLLSFNNGKKYYILDRVVSS